MLFSVQIKWLLGSYVTLPNNHDKGYWMGGKNVTFQLNVYTVAISFATKIVINEWLPLNKTGFLMLDVLLMCLEMSVTSSNVDVTSAISLDVDLTSPISSDVGLTTPMWKRLNVYWVFVTTVLARKFHKNFSEFPLKRCGTFFFFSR
jgi:hypothetical protein